MWQREADNLLRDHLAELEFHEEWHMLWPRCQSCRKWMSSDHVRCARHQWYLQQHFWAERLLQEERQRAANRAPFEHSSVVIEELDEVEKPELATASEETELPKANEVEPDLLQASEVQEPELPKANEVEPEQLEENPGAEQQQQEEQPSAEQQPGAEQHPSAEQQQQDDASAEQQQQDEQQSAAQQPNAEQHPSAEQHQQDEQQSAAQQPNAEHQPGAEQHAVEANESEPEIPGLPTTSESEEELVPVTQWWWHDIGTQTEPTTTEASTQTLYEIRRPLFLRRQASTQTLWSRGANFTRYDTAARYQ